MGNYSRFVFQHDLGSIHQTWEWGLFQGCRDNPRIVPTTFAVENENGQILASALVIRQKLPFGKCWLYCPRGPLLDYQNKEICSLLFDRIAALAHEQNAVFFRFDPALDANTPLTVFAPLKAGRAHAHYQPENTLILDLTLPENELLRQMKPKGRYNIKIAQKHGVTVHISDDPHRDAAIFHKLLQQTTDRDQFSGHPLDYYLNMFLFLHPQPKLYLAAYKNQVVAAIIVTYFKDMATYYFGASGNEHRNIMAPYLLQWQALLDAKKAGYHFYDFLGIAPLDQPNHPWAGVTDFKLKFGGRRVNYVSAQEIVYQPFWYALIRLVKWFRKGF